MTVFNDDLQSFIEIYKENAVQSRIIALQEAARFGSQRIFQFLRSNGTQLVSYGLEKAIYGGNTAIIQSFKMDTDMWGTYIACSMSARRLDIMEWLIDNSNDAGLTDLVAPAIVVLPIDCYRSLESHGTQVYNLRINCFYSSIFGSLISVLDSMFIT